MKKILSFSILFLFIFLNNSCTDKCKDVNCNNGICIEGNCSCDFGWTGDACNTKISSKFFGKWTGILDCVNDTVTFKIEDVPGNLQKIKMHSIGLEFNLGALPIDFDSYVLSADIDSSFTKFVFDTLPITLTVPQLGQDISVDITGDGMFLQDSTIDLNLKFKPMDPLPVINCSGNFKK